MGNGRTKQLWVLRQTWNCQFSVWYLRSDVWPTWWCDLSNLPPALGNLFFGLDLQMSLPTPTVLWYYEICLIRQLCMFWDQEGRRFLITRTYVWYKPCNASVLGDMGWCAHQWAKPMYLASCAPYRELLVLSLLSNIARSRRAWSTWVERLKGKWEFRKVCCGKKRKFLAQQSWYWHAWIRWWCNSNNTGKRKVSEGTAKVN